MVLESQHEKCILCKTGDVISVGRDCNLIVYTREGTKTAKHIEKRCNNKTMMCRAGHYYGYVMKGLTKIFDNKLKTQPQE